MKYSFIFLSFILFSLKFYGQAKTDSGLVPLDSVYTTVDEESTFEGGEKAWRFFLQNNLNPMVLVNNNAPDGVYTVVISFVVTTEGKIERITCENSSGYGICEEGIRVIKKSKKWIPA